MSLNWFDVDKEGLAKLLEHRSKGAVVLELFQNSWDQLNPHISGSMVAATLSPEHRGYYLLQVSDNDPDGFAKLSDAFTLYAESNKKGDPEKRGRFNEGEKKVLALCKHASISSTKGTVIFDSNGRRTTNVNQKRKSGSLFSGVIRMTRKEFDEAVAIISTIIPPTGVITMFNGNQIPHRTPITRFDAKLSTEIADEQGYLRKTIRKCVIEVYEPLDGEIATIYEMGIPVVPTGDKYHINISQKIPLNRDRDNVTPAFLKTIRTFVFNNVHENINEEDANSDWVRAATSDKRCSKEAMNTALDRRFTAKRVIYDPSDTEANNKAVSQGFQVIHGRELNRQEWQNVKDGELAKPAGQVTPAKIKFNKSVPVIPTDEWTRNMEVVAAYTKYLAKKLMNVDLRVSFIFADGLNATYEQGSPSHFVYYHKELGDDWYHMSNALEVDELIIHEFGHEYSPNHLSGEYHDALCNLAAKLKALVLEEPEFFLEYGC